MKGRKFQFSNFWTEYRNFRDCFRTVKAEFRDCFRTVRAKFSRLFLDSHDRIFGTIFRKSQTVLRFGFAPETDVFGFCGVFWCHDIR